MDPTNLNDGKGGDSAELDVNKIREFINLLQEHQAKCERTGKFVEADLAKQRVAQFKKIEEEKMKNDTKKIYDEQKATIEQNQKKELDSFNATWDQEYFNLANELNAQEQKLRELHSQEMEKRMKEFEENYPANTRPSSELLNLNKVLEQSVKQKDYAKAHQYQVRIEELSTIDANRYEAEKEKKTKAEIQKIKTKHDNEINALQMKAQSELGKLKTDRATEMNTLLQKFKNQMNELETNQKLEIGNFTKIMKGAARPNTRIQTIVKSFKQ